MVKKLLCMAICLVVLVFPPGWTLAAERIIAVSDRWMPYNGEPGSAQEGYAVEILRAVFESRGYEVVYREQPWKRAVDDVRVGRADVLIGVAKPEISEFIFPEQSLGQAEFCFFTKRQGWRFTGPASLKEVITGYIQGQGYPAWFLKEVREHPKQFHALHGEDAFARMLGMLREDRIQAIPAIRAVAEYYINNGGAQDEVFYAGSSKGDTRHLYFALSPADASRSKRLAATLDKGLSTLRNTGQLNYLLIKYGLKDWAGDL